MVHAIPLMLKGIFKMEQKKILYEKRSPNEKIKNDENL